MYSVPSREDITEFVQNVCTKGPTPGQAFCDHHCSILNSKVIPTELRQFIKYCGADPNRYTKEEKKKVDDRLLELCNGEVEAENVTTVQGTSMVLRSINSQVFNLLNIKSTKIPSFFPFLLEGYFEPASAPTECQLLYCFLTNILCLFFGGVNSYIE